MIGSNATGRPAAGMRGNRVSVGALAIAMLGAAPAAAQDTPAAVVASDAAAQADDSAAIVVTGSRIKRNGFDERSPATVVSAQSIENLGQVNIGEVINQIPQNTAFQSDTNAGPSNGSRASSNIGASYANLRGLNSYYGTRTLTLVNSRRFVPTSDGGAVDVNLIPSALIGRVETVTGGASAAYGSDAIAGVVNIIIDTKFKGVKGQIDYGETFRGDGGSKHGSLGFGTGFADGRGHIVLSGEYQKNKAVGDCADVRGWCAESWDVYTNAGVIVNGVASGYNVPGSPTYGQPNFVVAPGSRLAYNVSTGVIRNAAPAAAAVRNTQFNAAGTALVPFATGLYTQASQIGPRAGGDGPSSFADSVLRTPIERFSLYGHANYDLGGGIEATLEASYGQRRAIATGITLGPRASLVFQPDNAFLSPAVKALVGNTGFTLGKDLDDQVVNINDAKARTVRAVAGLNGKLGVGNWTWDAYYQYGRNTRHQSISRSRVNSFFDFATDAVVNPANGQIVCRATLPSAGAAANAAAAGCVPINLFGSNNLTQAGIDYAWRQAIEDFKYDQHVAAASVQGDLFGGIGAGPFGAAAGVEFRRDKGNVTHGNVPYYDQFALSLGLNYRGKIRVMEGFAELNAPLLRDLSFARLLELNGAVRYTENKSTDGSSGASKSVNTTSWKAGAVYEPIAGLRFRGTRSRDIRAAGFRELFQLQIASDPATAQGRVNNPFNGNVSDAAPILGGGSFALSPEKADTTTLGAVVSPLRRLRVSADWYQIRIADAVTTPSGQQIVDNCFTLKAFCDRITFNPAVAGNRDITYIDARQLNLGSFTTRGVDVEFDYTLDAGRGLSGAGGTLNLRVLGTYLYDMLIRATPGSPVINFAGQSGPSAPAGDFNPSPKWVLNGTLTYQDGPVTGTLQARYVGPGALSKTLIGPDDPRYSPQLINSISNNRVASRTYFTLGMTYRFKPMGGNVQAELFGVVENLFDKDPPVAPGTTGSVVQSSYPTNPAFFDTLGRRFRIGARVKY